LRVGVASAQIFAQNRNFASRKQTAIRHCEARQKSQRGNQGDQPHLRSAGFLRRSAPLNDKRMNDKTKLRNNKNKNRDKVF